VRWNVCRKALLFVLEATMSEQVVVQIWLSFLVAVIAMTVVGKPDMVKAVVKELVRVLLSILPHGR
jgi:hypothetical protein